MERLTLANMTTLELEAMAGLLLLQTERLHVTPIRKRQVVSINNNVEEYPQAATGTSECNHPFRPEITSSPNESTTTAQLEDLVREAVIRRTNVSAERAVLAVSAVRSAPDPFSPPTASTAPSICLIPTSKAQTKMRLKKVPPQKIIQNEIFDVVELADSDEEWQPTEHNQNSRQKARRYTTSSSSNKENLNLSEDSAQEEEMAKMKSDPDLVPIGEGNAKVPARLLKNIDWNSSYTTVTRKLLTAIFPRSVLATHSLTGKPSPAFPNKPAKKKLNTALVNDIVQTVSEKCHVPETVVRTSITTKCADESKMLRSRQRSNKT